MTVVEKNFLAILSIANATMGGFCAPLLLWAFKDELLKAVRDFGAEDVIRTFSSGSIDADTFEILGGSEWHSLFSGAGTPKERAALRRVFAEIQTGKTTSDGRRLPALQFVCNTCRDAILADA
jgi:hypothetical protein